MVKRIYPSSADFESLSRLRTEASSGANQFDYSKVVVQKPWGYEYLWHQNAAVAIWMLHLKQDCATSIHCHVRKRTSLIVMAGEVVCSTFDDRYPMKAGEAVVLEPCVFHTTAAVSAGGACVMEVETPPMKGDLLRYRDNFGRAGQGYEGTSQYSTDLAAFDHAPLAGLGAGGAPFAFQRMRLRVCAFQTRAELAAQLTPACLVVPVLGRLAVERNIIADIGEAVVARCLLVAGLPAQFPPVELLQVECG